jgi:hypothetical protein
VKRRKSPYDLDMGSFRRLDNYRIIADRDTQSFLAFLPPNNLKSEMLVLRPYEKIFQIVYKIIDNNLKVCLS